MNQSETGMRVVISTYDKNKQVIGTKEFYVDDEVDVITEVDKVEHFLFEHYDQFLERSGNDSTRSE